MTKTNIIHKPRFQNKKINNKFADLRDLAER